MRRYLTMAMLGRLATLVAGLFCFALGIVLNLQSNLGLAPWNAFHFGLHRQFGVTLGEASLAVGFFMVGISWLAGIRPGLGTLANMTLVGFFTDRLLDTGLVPPQLDVAPQLLMLGTGIMTQALGTAIYIGPRLGAGPRDSFMLVVSRRLGARVGVVRSGMEATVLALGWLLGSPIGLGTVAFAFGIGPAIQLTFRLLRVQPLGHQAPRPAPVAVSAEPGD